MAQSKRTAASYIAEQRNTTAGNPFMGMTKQQMMEKYDKEIRKSGKSAKELRKIANQMQAALKKPVKQSKVTKPVTGTTPKRRQTPAAATTTPTPSNTRRKRQTGSTGGRGGSVSSKSSSGTYGSPLPSNPKLKSQDTSRLSGRQKIALQVAAASGGGSSHKRGASRKPTNPKKNETYVTRTGMTMVWTGKNWKQKTK